MNVSGEGAEGPSIFPSLPHFLALSLSLSFSSLLLTPCDVYSSRQIVRTRASVTAYGSQLEAGLLSSR